MAGNKEYNLKVHVTFGYKKYYIDYKNNIIYDWDSWAASYNDKVSSFDGSETDLKRKVGKSAANDKDFYFTNLDKWDLL